MCSKNLEGDRCVWFQGMPVKGFPARVLFGEQRRSYLSSSSKSGASFTSETTGNKVVTGGGEVCAVTNEI